MKMIIYKYIGVFCITFGLSLILVSNIPTIKIKASEQSPYTQIFEQSLEDIQDFKEYMEQAEEMSLSCDIENQEEISDKSSLIQLIEQKSRSKHTCILEKRDNLKKIKTSKYFEQTLKTYQLINESFNSVQEILENQVIKNQKQATKNRKGY